jgi:hypothetical protein
MDTALIILRYAQNGRGKELLEVYAYAEMATLCVCVCRVDCVTFSIDLLVQVDEATKNITEHSCYIGVIMEKRKTEARVMIANWVKISFN